MYGSKYSPVRRDEYGAKDINVAFKGVTFTAAPGAETSNDLEISDDMLLDGARVVVIGAALGDKLKGQVVDTHGVYAPAGTVLGEYVKDWYMNPASTLQFDFDSEYPAKIYAALSLRLIYTSTGLVAPQVIANYKLHKVLW
jgi:hypothetical protein